MIAHCLFEQSGTFKQQFIKLGVNAYDYDILNDFGQTDYIIDLFDEIEKAYNDENSIFDNIKQDDIILAFFPCIMFEQQQLLWFRGDSYSQRNWNDLQKLEYNITEIKKLHDLYIHISKLAHIALSRKLKLIIENPYSQQHFLVKYWSMKATIIDMDRRKSGDYFTKPTQYFFINIEPKNNINIGKKLIIPKKTISNTHNKVERSLISPQYAEKFIKTYILD